MTSLLVLAFLSIVFYRCFLLFILLFTASLLFLFFQAASLEVTLGQITLLAMAAISIPLAAWLAAIILNRFAHSKLKFVNWNLLVVLVLVNVVFSNEQLFEFLEAGAAIHQNEVSSNLLFVFSLAGKALFSGALIAFVIMLLVNAVEFPFYCLKNTLELRVAFPLKALRSLSVLVLFALAFNLIIEFMLHILGPGKLFG